MSWGIPCARVTVLGNPMCVGVYSLKSLLHVAIFQVLRTTHHVQRSAMRITHMWNHVKLLFDSTTRFKYEAHTHKFYVTTVATSKLRGENKKSLKGRICTNRSDRWCFLLCGWVNLEYLRQRALVCHALNLISDVACIVQR